MINSAVVFMVLRPRTVTLFDCDHSWMTSATIGTTLSLRSRSGIFLNSQSHCIWLSDKRVAGGNVVDLTTYCKHIFIRTKSRALW